MEKESLADMARLLSIDLEALHNDIQMQAVLYQKASELMSDAKMAMERAKLEVDRASARIELEIRKNPSFFGLGEKTTESSIKAALALVEEIRLMEDRLLEKTKAYIDASSLCSAFEQRSKMLTNEVHLFGSNYWGQKAEVNMSKEESERIMQEVGSKRKKKSEQL